MVDVMIPYNHVRLRCLLSREENLRSFPTRFHFAKASLGEKVCQEILTENTGSQRRETPIKMNYVSPNSSNRNGIEARYKLNKAKATGVSEIDGKYALDDTSEISSPTKSPPAVTSPLVRNLPNRLVQTIRRRGSNDLDDRTRIQKLRRILLKYITFIGPGFMIAVSYIDPGNYSTDVTAGALFQYKHLFILFLTNLFAIYLQSISCKLGCVTGLNIAEVCRKRCPLWVNIITYFFCEVAIIATDLAEVIGTAIALNILFKIPLVAGVALTMTDVLIVLMAWRPDGSMRATRYFEIFVAVLVLVVVVSFVILLTKVEANGKDVLSGYLPSKTVIDPSGIYTSLSILGAVVMPHSLILGTGLTQPRMREYDVRKGNISPNAQISEGNTYDDSLKYIPSLAAVRSTLSYSIVEMTLSLLTFALFVNSAILVVAGSTLFGIDAAANADLFGIHDLLRDLLSPAAGTIFALALLASGQSAGIVTTMAGQLVSEGFFRWTIKPWLRRTITRGIAVAPCLVVAASVGRSGLADVLNASQVALSILLPIIIFPILWFTGDKNCMRVPLSIRRRASEEPLRFDSSVDDISLHRVDSRSPPGNHQTCTADAGDMDMEEDAEVEYVDMSNSRLTKIVGWGIWAFITGLNMYLMILLGKGETGPGK